MAYKEINSAEMLSLMGSLDPFRNPRDVRWGVVGLGKMRVWGILRDDSTIPNDLPRQRVETLSFDVVIPENASLWDLQVAIQQQSQRFAGS